MANEAHIYILDCTMGISTLVVPFNVSFTHIPYPQVGVATPHLSAVAILPQSTHPAIAFSLFRSCGPFD